MLGRGKGRVERHKREKYISVGVETERGQLSYLRGYDYTYYI